MPNDQRPAPPARADFAFFHQLRVRWAEVDAQNIVFNANYVMYFDVAATEYWREMGVDFITGLSRHGVDIVVRAVNAAFHASATADDILDIGVRCMREGRTSLTYQFGVFRGEELLVEGELIYVCIGLDTRAPAPVPDALRASIGKMEQSGGVSA